MEWMRRIDSWIGVPLLWLLSPILKGPEDKTPPKSMEKSVVLIKLLGMGSVILSLPLLETLKQQGYRTSYICFASHQEILTLSGLTDEVIAISLRTPWSSIRSLWQAVKFLRSGKVYWIIDLEPTSNLTALLSWISNCKKRSGFTCGKPLREKVFHHLVAYSSAEHISQVMLHFAPESSAFSSQELRPSESILNLPPVGVSRSYLVLNINSSELSWHRRWPESHWALLLQKLAAEPHFSDFQFILTGIDAEWQRIEDVIQLAQVKSAFNFARQTTLTELGRLLFHSEGVISVDSGTMHLAAWVGTPLVALFGPESPNSFGPKGTGHKVVLTKNLACSPCLTVATNKLSLCQNNQCMKQIDVDSVYSAIQGILKKKRTENAS